MEINQEKITKLRNMATRTLNILSGLESGLTISEVANNLNCQRQLVEYYANALKPDEPIL